MEMQAGWVTEAGAGEPLAHQLAPSEGAGPVGTLCEVYAGPDGWEPASPGVERCQDCQLVAAGPAPD